MYLPCINDEGDDWGVYIYDNAADRPEEERIWYDLMTIDDTHVNDVLHFWQQFCLNWEILTGELQRLSKAKGPTDNLADGVSPLTIFASDFPILFECLYAVFGPMMSNS